MHHWSHLAAAEPELAAAGARLLADPDGSPGVAFLATTSSTDRPRIHPFIPLVLDGHLWAFILDTSPKRRDLDRDGQYAIHARLGPKDEQFTVSGLAHRLEDSALRTPVGTAMSYDDIDEHHILYRFDIDTALWTTWTTPTEPVHHRWRASDR